MAKKKEKKEKKAGKRMSKKQLAALLIDFFHAKQSETLSMKYIFSELHLTTHPQKMLCVDILHEMLDDDYISEIEKGKFRLNNHGTEMTGTFQRKSNGKNSFIPEGGGDPIFVAERNSAHAMNNDKVKITFYAKRKNKEAVASQGLLGVLTGPLTAGAAGITAAMISGLLVSFFAKPKDK